MIETRDETKISGVSIGTHTHNDCSVYESYDNARV